MIAALKFTATAVNGLNDDDVKISKRLNLSSRKLRGFEPRKIGPKDGKDFIGGNYAYSVNLEANLPNFFPEKSNAEIGLFLDAGNVWGVDYSDALDDSNELGSTIGINTSWLSPAGPLSFIFSQNVTKASTDVDQSFNFRLGTTFNMKNISKILLFAIILFTYSVSNTFANDIYFIDFAKVMNESKAGKKAQDYLKSTLKSSNKKFKETAKKIKDEENKIISQKNVLSKEEYKKSWRIKKKSFQFK